VFSKQYNSLTKFSASTSKTKTGTGVKTQGLMLARQMLYQLRHMFILFCFSFFQEGSCFFLPGLALNYYFSIYLPSSWVYKCKLLWLTKTGVVQKNTFSSKWCLLYLLMLCSLNLSFFKIHIKTTYRLRTAKISLAQSLVMT
jgi:hypothetical protein